MTKAVILIPTSTEANLASALEIAKTTNAVIFNAVEDVKAAQAFIANNQKDVLLEKIVADFQALNANLVVVKGVQPSAQAPFANSLNFSIAQTLDAQIILVANNEEGTLVEAIASEFGGVNNADILGVFGAQAGKIKTFDAQAGKIKTFDAQALVAAISAPLTREARISPAAFRFKLTDLARKAGKTIVLPEGDEPRTVKAAAICAERGIAKSVLLADPESVKKVAAEQGVTLGANVTIINPADVRENYVARLVELRKSKGLTEEQARAQLEDTVVLGTMMLEAGEVDGLVSGAVHTTANTIRPPMQIIKTAPGSSIISSVFFMLLPDQVLVYGDCAVNPEPTAEQLAEIAIQSAESAKAFGLEPKVAMLSYSTGTSGAGQSVEKVKEATRIAQEKRPDLLIDGPLQYDAAVMKDVAASKAPNSKVAGQANVFVFPDINAGNIGYKAVQRSADLVAVGPMLQGMRKPVNDLSRGALVDDIVYTIALTAIQATQ